MTITQRSPLGSDVTGAAARTGRGWWRAFTLTTLVLAVVLQGACSTESAFPRDQNWGSPIGRVEAGADGGADAAESIDGPDEAADSAAPAADAAEAGTGEATEDAGGSSASSDAATDTPAAPANGGDDAGPTAASDQATTARRRGT